MLSNFILIAIHLIAAKRRGVDGLWLYALLMPFYWLLISVGAWKGAWQLLWRPYYWEKTLHGLSENVNSVELDGRRLSRREKEDAMCNEGEDIK